MIIKIDEIVPQSLTKNEPSDRNQSEADIKGRESPRRAVFYRTVEQPECVLPGYAFILALAHVRQNSLRQSSNDQRPIHMTCAFCWVLCVFVVETITILLELAAAFLYARISIMN